ncbi:MAG TPA: phosphoribosyltransferase family protein [Patescibacteria group bacterium]|nr:phosphoribosyltransferase family protein [Patescibacteria group bacterium]
MILANRAEAGELLAGKLLAYTDKDTVVYALPRGGVIVGAVIARKLKTPLEVIIARKIGHPLQPEFGIAAVTEGGHLIKNEKYAATVDENWFSVEIERQKTAAQHRRNLYRPALRGISAKDKVAILTDDGVATGLTTKAAISDLREQQPQKIILAVPVIPADTAKELAQLIDEVVVLDTPEDFAGAVGAYYEEFPQVNDEEVIHELKAVNRL